MTFFDFNSAAEQSSYDLIPKGTMVRVRMTIKPGGYDDPSQGWTDNSPAAQNARRISGFSDLEGIEFLGKVDWEKDQNGQDKCVIKSAVTPEHKEYAAHMNGAAPAAPSASAPNAYAQATGRAPVPGRPSWAQ